MAIAGAWLVQKIYTFIKLNSSRFQSIPNSFVVIYCVCFGFTQQGRLRQTLTVLIPILRFSFFNICGGSPLRLFTLLLSSICDSLTEIGAKVIAATQHILIKTKSNLLVLCLASFQNPFDGILEDHVDVFIKLSCQQGMQHSVVQPQCLV